MAGVGPNVMAKESRYSARGITHNSVTAARSVLMNVVTPMVKLEGTKATATQSALVAPVHISA